MTGSDAVMTLKKMGRMALLSDFYGSLLTPKQQEIIKFYYEQDLSLTEIAENVNTSRQAVHDNLKRAERSLENYEKKLGLLAGYLKEIGLNQPAGREARDCGVSRPSREVTGHIQEITREREAD